MSEQKSLLVAVSEAIQYFKADQPPERITQKLFEGHLICLEKVLSNPKYQKIHTKLIDLLLQRYSSLLQSPHVLNQWEEYLQLKVTQVISQAALGLFTTPNPEVRLTDYAPVTLWSLVSHLKKVFQNHSSNRSDSKQPPKQLTSALLLQISKVVNKAMKTKTLTIKQIYPQLFGVLMEKIVTQDWIFQVQSETVRNFSKSDYRVHWKLPLKHLDCVLDLLTFIIRENIKFVTANLEKHIGKQFPDISGSNVLQELKILSQLLSSKSNERAAMQQVDQTMERFNLLTYEEKCEQKLSASLQAITKIVQFLRTDSNSSETYKMAVTQKYSKFVSSLFFADQSQKCLHSFLFIHNEDFLEVLLLLCIQLQSSFTGALSTKRKIGVLHLFTKLINSVPIYAKKQVWTQVSKRQIQVWVLKVFKKVFAQTFERFCDRTSEPLLISSEKTWILQKLNVVAQFFEPNAIRAEKPLYGMGDAMQAQNFKCSLDRIFTLSEKSFEKPIIQVFSHLSAESSGPGSWLVPIKPEDRFDSYLIGFETLKDSVRKSEYQSILSSQHIFSNFEGESRNLELFDELLNRSLSVDFRVTLLLLYAEAYLQLEMNSSHSANAFAFKIDSKRFFALLYHLFIISRLTSSREVLDYSEQGGHWAVKLKTRLSQLFEHLLQSERLQRTKVNNGPEELMVYWQLLTITRLGDHLRKIGSSETGSRARDMKRLGRTVGMMEHIVGSLEHESTLIRMKCYEVLLVEAAPASVGQMMRPLQATLIHRNIGTYFGLSDNSTLSEKAHEKKLSPLLNKPYNLEFVKNLLKVARLQESEAEEVVTAYIQRQSFRFSHSTAAFADPQLSLKIETDGFEVMNSVFTSLSPQSMRTCILTLRSWYLVLNSDQNLQKLNNMPYDQKKKSKTNPKTINFAMNDPENVTISNLLGVVLIELGHQKWVHSIKSKHKEVVLDLLIKLVTINDQMAFWKRFFFCTESSNSFTQGAIFMALVDLYTSDKDSTLKYHSRLRFKIITILSKVPEVSYSAYLPVLWDHEQQNRQKLSENKQKTPKQKSSSQHLVVSTGSLKSFFNQLSKENNELKKECLFGFGGISTNISQESQQEIARKLKLCKQTSKVLEILEGVLQHSKDQTEAVSE